MSVAELLPTPLHEAAPAHTTRISLDPRTALLMLVVVNVVALGNTPVMAVASATTLVAMLLATTVPWHVSLTYTAVMATAFALYFALPQVWTGFISATAVVVLYYLVRFATSLGAAAFVLLTVKPATLIAALRAMRVPSAVVIPIAVMMRFIPIVGAEARDVVAAMRLRGLEPGGWGLVRRPLRTLELVLVPLLASVSRIADDLTASGMVRGLGAPHRPTSLVRLRFGLGAC